MRSPLSEMESLQVTRVAIVILYCQGWIWARKRRATGHLDGYLEFPGGKVERGETAVSAASRELWEETGYRHEDRLESIQVTEHQYSGRHFRLEFFLAVLQDRPRLPVDGLWLDARVLKATEFPPANSAVLQLLKGLATTAKPGDSPG